MLLTDHAASDGRDYLTRADRTLQPTARNLKGHLANTLNRATIGSRGKSGLPATKARKPSIGTALVPSNCVLVLHLGHKAMNLRL